MCESNGEYKCDFCGDVVEMDDVHERSSWMDGYVITFHACSKWECMEDLRNRI